MEKIPRRRLLGRYLPGVFLSWLLASCRQAPETPPSATPLILPEISKYLSSGQIEIEKNLFAESWKNWQEQYLVDAGNNQLRVRVPEDKDATYSEGMAYGMMFSAGRNRDIFDKLTNYVLGHLNSNGLMSWKWNANGSLGGSEKGEPDHNSATDADLDMAYSLVMADKIWGEYQDLAIKMLDRIMTADVEQETFVLKPGDGWGGSGINGAANDIVNPSYFSPAYYQIFKQYTGDPRWNEVAASSKRILTLAGAKTALFPNWSTVNGNPVATPGIKERPDNYDYTYDATRIPLRQATALLYFPDQLEVSGLARAAIEKVNLFFEKINPSRIVDGYNYQGLPIGHYHNAAFVSPIAVASIFSRNENFKQATISELNSLSENNYYSDSLRVWGLLILSGNLIYSQ